MNRSEIQKIIARINDAREGLSEGDGYVTMQMHITDLHSIIERLMNATFRANNPKKKVVLARIQRGARSTKRQIEDRLGTRN